MSQCSEGYAGSCTTRTKTRRNPAPAPRCPMQHADGWFGRSSGGVQRTCYTAACLAPPNVKSSASSAQSPFPQPLCLSLFSTPKTKPPHLPSPPPTQLANVLPRPKHKAKRARLRPPTLFTPLHFCRQAIIGTTTTTCCCCCSSSPFSSS